jgi:hypothetical protein
MRFITLQTDDGKTLFLNVAAVISVQPHSEDGERSVIRLADNTECIALSPAAEMVAMLEGSATTDG